MANIDNDLRTVLDGLRTAVTDLTARVAALERTVGPDRAAAPGAAAGRERTSLGAPETVSEDVLLVIAAAVAGFLGERAHIRQVRLISSSAWAQQGRVSVQASHRLNR